MGQFSYKAVNQTGGHVTGIVEAADRRSAVANLAEQGQFVTELAEEAKAALAGGREKASLSLSNLSEFSLHRVNSKDLLAFTGQLSTALRAGLPLLNALEIIRGQQRKPAMKKMLSELVKSVSSGQSLSEAMTRYGKVFSPLYTSMVRVGETGGVLEQTTAQLTGILGRDEKVKTNMKNAAAYPIFILCVGFASVVVIITWVLPNILATISGGDAVLPWPTRALLATSGFVRVYGWLVIVLFAAGIYSFRKWINSAGRGRWDAFKLKVPVLGAVLRTIAVGRFARTLGALTEGGVTILESLGVVRDTLGNELLGREIDEVAEKVRAGASLAGPLEVSGYFPLLLVQIVSIGEQTGKLGELLLGAADTFDEEADSAIDRFIAVFPAVLILLLALVIGFIIAAILLPIAQMGLGTGLF